MTVVISLSLPRTASIACLRPQQEQWWHPDANDEPFYVEREHCILFCYASVLTVFTGLRQCFVALIQARLQSCAIYPRTHVSAFIPNHHEHHTICDEQPPIDDHSFETHMRMTCIRLKPARVGQTVMRRTTNCCQSCCPPKNRSSQGSMQGCEPATSPHLCPVKVDSKHFYKPAVIIFTSFEAQTEQTSKHWLYQPRLTSSLLIFNVDA